VIELARMDGWRELQGVLKDLPRALAQNALNATARAGAIELQKSAMAQLSLAMSRSAREGDVVIKKSRGVKGEDVQATYLVGPPKRLPWLRWLHDGTKPHPIELRRAKALYSRRAGKFFGTFIQHPGQRARPWLKQAQFLSGDTVIRAMAEKMAQALPKQVDRLVTDKYRDQTLKKWLR